MVFVMSGFDEFLEKSKLANVIPVIETLPADLLTPLSVYLKLSKNTADSFLLESVSRLIAILFKLVPLMIGRARSFHKALTRMSTDAIAKMAGPTG